METGTTSTATFVSKCCFRGHPVSLRSIIAGGDDQPFPHYGLSGCRRIGIHLEQAVEVLVRQLRQLYRHPMPCPTQLLLPFALRNPPGDLG
jgi:hypothetical protein